MLPYIDPECKRFLKAVKKICTSQNTDTAFIEALEAETKLSRQHLCDIADFLESLHIVTVDYYSDNTGNKVIAGVHPTQLGRHYLRYRFQDFTKTVLFSIILPLIISAVSGSLTSLLIQILSKQQ